MAAVAAATAFGVTYKDADDVGGKLDLKMVSATVKGKNLIFKVGTYEAFTAEELTRDGSLNSLVVSFDTNDDGKADSKAKIVSFPNGKWYAVFSGKAKKLESVQAKRAGNVITVKVPVDAVAKGTISVSAASTHRTCTCAQPNNDVAPDAGWLKAR
jgi:hypothetical protein